MSKAALPAAVTPPAPRTAGARVRAALEKQILSGALAPGAHLDETRISARFGVSRTPVREALHQLAASGLVAIRAHEGATVVKPTAVELIERFEVMSLLEASCASLAAQRHIIADQAAMREALAQCQQAEANGDGLAFHDANNRFHEAIFLATHNGFLTDEALRLRNRLIPFRRYVAFHPGRMSRSNAQHRAIMEAIFALQSERASALMSQHLATLRDDVMTVVSAERGGRPGGRRHKRQFAMIAEETSG